MHNPNEGIIYLGRQKDNSDLLKKEQIRYLKDALGEEGFEILERLEKQRFFSAYITSA